MQKTSLFRVLAGRPWPAGAGAGHPVLEAMGEAFVLCNVRPDFARRVADVWMRWCMPRIRRGIQLWWSVAGDET